ncbi:MAG: AsmA-like C-terminal domain-containing protein [Syntrophales bacterium]|jgi:hypothetical protein|nr:AsmA-like C-terminal domain-containing protein [Syntrophales bacterium]MCK9528667.1 AsmA-like C-terminal domain-containing protein [Syntrophales bacterium]MDX9922027.1 AsmA-like C-terminal domain-containing protein [Syntrophales bacterium]
MSRFRARILPAAVVLAAAVILAVLAWGAARIMDPDRFGAILAERMEARLGMEVSLERASVSFSRGPVITFRNITIGSPDGTSRFTSGVLEARLSLFSLLLGRITVTRVTLVGPTVVVETLAFPPSSSGGGDDVPMLDIRGGTLIVGRDPGRIVLDGIEGSLDAGAIHGTASFKGQKIVADLAFSESSLRGVVDLKDVDLKRVHPFLLGRTDARISVLTGPRSARLDCTLAARDFKLHWWTEEIAVQTSFVLQADEDRVSLSDLDFHCPAMHLSGSGELSGYRHGKNNEEARLTLSARTSELDYESVIALLPLHLFPEWLDLLLARQVRDGTVTITELKYEGTPAELLSAEHFLEGLRIEAMLRDLSFGACHDDSRVHRISGRAALSGATLSFHDLSGQAGSSRVDEVELLFDNITRGDDLEVSVRVRADMELPDFVTAWRASMTPRNVYDLLGPLSDARGGRIQGSVYTWSGPERSGPVRVRGDAAVEGGLFRWDNHVLESLEGRAYKESFEDSLVISAEGIIDDYAVDDFRLSMPDPFREKTYDLSFNLTRPPGPYLEEVIRFGKGLTIAASGRGAGNRVDGTIRIALPETITAAGEYGPDEVRVDGSFTIGSDCISSEDISILYGDVTGLVSGCVTLGDVKRFEGSITLDNLVIDEQVSERMSLLGGYAGSARVLLRNTLFRGIPIETLETLADLEEGVLRLEDFECRLSDGRVRGRLVFEPSLTPRFDLELDVGRADITKLIEAFSSSQSPIEGWLAAQGTLRGSLDALNGDMAIEANDGRLQHFSVMSKILTVTNLYRLFAPEPTGLFEQGLKFNRLAVSLKIRDGMASFEDFLMESPSIQAAAAGCFDVGEKTIDAVIVMQPLETIDRIIGMIPLVNWILLGNERRLVVVSAKVRGPVEDPSIRLTPLDTLSRPVTGILLRTLRLPLDIILKPGVLVPGGQSRSQGTDQP